MDELLKDAVAKSAQSEELLELLEVITNVLEGPMSVRKKLEAFNWLEHILDNQKDKVQDELGKDSIFKFANFVDFENQCFLTLSSPAFLTL